MEIRARAKCLDALRGTVVWKKSLARDYKLEEFSGITPSPLIEGNLLVLVIGGKPNACVVALDKDSGKEVWTVPRSKATDDLAFDATGKVARRLPLNPAYVQALLKA